MKKKMLLTLLFSILLSIGFFLASCKSGAEQVEPAEAEVATIVAQTLTQVAFDQLEMTLQPDQQESGEMTSDQEFGAGQMAEVQGIPGLDVAALLEQLVGFGFDCTESETQEGVLVRECGFETSEYHFFVTLWSKTPDTADLIEALALYYGDLDYSSLASIVFELIAKTPYEGADPESASAWVQSNLPDIREVGDEAFNAFGGVRFYMYAFPSSQVLEIGSLRP